MISFTESFFLMPIRIQDGYSVKKAQEHEETFNIRTDAPYLVGYKRVKLEDIEGWFDAFTGTVDDFQEFDCTVVETVREMFTCDWSRKKFEAELDKHYERIKVELEETSKSFLSLCATSKTEENESL